MAARAVVGGGDVLDPVGVGGELIALLEADPRLVLRIVNRDGAAAGLFHHGEAGDIGRSVADIDHVLERDGPQFGRHVVVDVLREVEHALVDTEEKLRLLRVADDALGEGDMSFVILRVFAAENFAHIRFDAAADDKFFQSGADNVVLDADAVGLMLGAEESGFEFLEHLRDTREEAEFGPEFAELGVGRTVRLEVIEKRLHVGQFVFEAVLLHEIAAALPELLSVDPEVRKNCFFLHIIRAQGLVVVVNYGDGALRNGHDKQRHWGVVGPAYLHGDEFPARLWPPGRIPT